MGVPSVRPHPQEVSLNDIVEQMHGLHDVLILDGRQEGTKSTKDKKQKLEENIEVLNSRIAEAGS
jgi:hypothetical protein